MTNFECEICHKIITNPSSIGKHVKTYNITSKEYYDKYIKSMDDGICKTCGLPTKFLGIYRGYNNFCNSKCANNNENIREKIKTTYFIRTGYSHNMQNPESKEKAKQTSIKHFGVAEPLSSDIIRNKSYKTKELKYNNKNYVNAEQRLKTMEKMYGGSGAASPMIALKMFNTKKKKYNDGFYTNRPAFFKKYKSETGYDNPFSNPESRQRGKETCLKLYGANDYHKSKKFKNDIGKILNKRISKYKYHDKMFDSGWELYYYIWLEDNKINFEYHPDISFTYYVGSKEYQYFPDFIVENDIVEIKGDCFFNENNEMINPYNSDENSKAAAKYNCMIEHNVIIKRFIDLKNIFKYVHNHYGKNYIKEFKVNKYNVNELMR